MFDYEKNITNHSNEKKKYNLIKIFSDIQVVKPENKKFSLGKFG